jgi:integrative and conjugative element protein (TIGR02256 family)
MQESSCQVWIHEAVIQFIEAEAARFFPKETGGVLVGYWVSMPNEAVLTDVIGPGQKASHSFSSFLPDHDFQQSEIERLYQSSGRLHTYMGDWHTHPKQDAYLSPTDRSTLRKIALHKEARNASPLMAVLGNGPNWNLKVWRYEPTWFAHFGVRTKAVEMQLRIYC